MHEMRICPHEMRTKNGSFFMHFLESWCCGRRSSNSLYLEPCKKRNLLSVRVKFEKSRFASLPTQENSGRYFHHSGILAPHFDGEQCLLPATH